MDWYPSSDSCLHSSYSLCYRRRSHLYNRNLHHSWSLCEYIQDKFLSIGLQCSNGLLCPLTTCERDHQLAAVVPPQARGTVSFHGWSAVSYPFCEIYSMVLN